MKESVEAKADLLRRISHHLAIRTIHPGEDDRLRFLLSWSLLLKARAEWMETQNDLQFLTAEDILRLSQMEIEMAESFLPEVLQPS